MVLSTVLGVPALTMPGQSTEVRRAISVDQTVASRRTEGILTRHGAVPGMRNTKAEHSIGCCRAPARPISADRPRHTRRFPTATAIHTHPHPDHPPMLLTTTYNNKRQAGRPAPAPTTVTAQQGRGGAAIHNDGADLPNRSFFPCSQTFDPGFRRFLWR